MQQFVGIQIVLSIIYSSVVGCIHGNTLYLYIYLYIYIHTYIYIQEDESSIKQMHNLTGCLNPNVSDLTRYLFSRTGSKISIL